MRSKPKVFDLQVGYAFDTARHGHNFDYAATILDQLDTIPFPGATQIECAGKFSTQCKPPSPEYRHRLLYTWQTPWSIDVTATWRHFGSVDHQNPAETLETSMIRSITSICPPAGTLWMTASRSG